LRDAARAALLAEGIRDPARAVSLFVPVSFDSLRSLRTDGRPA
jgi:hypothetical protein